MTTLTSQKINRLRPTSIIDFKSYQSFRDNNRDICTRENVPNYVEHGKILSLFYRKIGEYVTKSSEGVWIDKLGYFGVLNTNLKKNPKGFKFFDEFNWETKGYAFCLYFMPYQNSSLLFRTFSMDYSFNPKIKSNLSKQLKKRFRYNFNGFMFIKNTISKGD